MTRQLVQILSEVHRAMECTYWDQVKNETVPDPSYREAMKRVRARIYLLQKQEGNIE